MQPLYFKFSTLDVSAECEDLRAENGWIRKKKNVFTPFSQWAFSVAGGKVNSIPLKHGYDLSIYFFFRLEPTYFLPFPTYFLTCFLAPLCHRTPMENLYACADICGHLRLRRTEAAIVSADEVFTVFPASNFFFELALTVAACMQPWKTGAFVFNSVSHFSSENEIMSSGAHFLNIDRFLLLQRLLHSSFISACTFLKSSLFNSGCFQTALAAYR